MRKIPNYFGSRTHEKPYWMNPLFLKMFLICKFYFLEYIQCGCTDFSFSYAPINLEPDSKFQSNLSSLEVSKAVSLDRWRDPDEWPMEKKVSALAQPVLLDTRDSKGNEKEKTVSSFKKRLGINASPWQKVDLLIRKEGLIWKGRSTSNKYKTSQKQLRSILRSVLETIAIYGRFNLSLWFLLLSEG